VTGSPAENYLQDFLHAKEEFVSEATVQEMKALLSADERELYERYVNRRKEAFQSMMQPIVIMAIESEAKLDDQRTRLTEIDNHANNPRVTALLAEVEQELVQSNNARLAEALTSLQSDSMAHVRFGELLDPLTNNEELIMVDQEPFESNSNLWAEAPLSDLEQDLIMANEIPLVDLLQVFLGTEIETNNERSGLESETGCVID